MSQTQPKSGNLPVTLATYLFILDSSGHRASHDALNAAIDHLRDAGPDAQTESLGQSLVAIVEKALGSDPSFAQVVDWLTTLYGAGRLATSLGEDRTSRIRAARAYMFSSSLPWIARIFDRFPDGSVGTHWVMVEQLTDTVTCMDPYPWDDLDEEYTVPLVEFAVKWELAGSDSIRFIAP